MTLARMALLMAAAAAALFGGAASASPAQTPPGDRAAPETAEDSALRLQDLPRGLAAALRENSKRISALAEQARKSLQNYLEHEKAGRYKEAYGLLYSGLRQGFAQDETNQAIINDIRLYQKPPARPQPHQREAINRVKALVENGRLSLELNEPTLWAYQWTHSTGSVDAVFEATGPFANQFRLVGFQIIRVIAASDDLVVGWVCEEIGMPDSIVVCRLSQYLLKPDGGAWRIWGCRALDGPRLESWFGQRTCLWPDQLAGQSKTRPQQRPGRKGK